MWWDYKIDKNKHYFVLMHPLECFCGIAFTTSTSREKWVECEITEERYKIDDGYKVELKSIEPGYGKEKFYQDDFKSMINKGFIIEKTSKNQKVKEIFWEEPLCGAAVLRHSAYIVE